MAVEIGRKVMQPGGFSAFIPHSFPQRRLFDLPSQLLLKAAEAARQVGKLDGVIHTLPDVDCFLKMFAHKEAAASSQIEGTQATIIDALKRESDLPQEASDADDIHYYVKALNYSLKRLNEDDFPLSLRLLREIHRELMTGARATHFSSPGEFRTSQNYIGGTRPGNAVFVPPPAAKMQKALNDFEKFLHDESQAPLIHIAVSHAHFEAIHPFLDGNGRTGRLLITLLLQHKKLLERPALFLSSFFKKHQKLYYERLNDYHEGRGLEWISFFIDAVIETAAASIKIAKKIREIRDKDMEKIQSLGKREAKSGMRILLCLFRAPITSPARAGGWTGFTRAGAKKALDRFVSLNILSLQKPKTGAGNIYIYEKYLRAFLED